MYLSIISGAKEALENFFNNIIEFFNYVGDIISHIFEGANKSIGILEDAYYFIQQLMQYMPNWLLSSVGLTIFISVIYVLIGREQG